MLGEFIMPKKKTKENNNQQGQQQDEILTRTERLEKMYKQGINPFQIGRAHV